MPIYQHRDSLVDYPLDYSWVDWCAMPSINFVDNWISLSCSIPIASEWHGNLAFYMVELDFDAAAPDWMWNAVGNFVAKIPLDVPYYAKLIMESGTRACRLVRDACRLMCRVPSLFHAYATWPDDFETTPVWQKGRDELIIQFFIVEARRERPYRNGWPHPTPCISLKWLFSVTREIVKHNANGTALPLTNH